MPGAPVVRPSALTPVLNTLPRRTGEREVRSSALLLAVYLFFNITNIRCFFSVAQGFPPRPCLYWKQEKKRAPELFRKMEMTVYNPVEVRRHSSASVS